MSTVKITELPPLTQLDTNASNTIFVIVDTPSDSTNQITMKTLAANLYTNEVLRVGKGIKHTVNENSNTTLTIDFSKDSLIKCSTSDDLTINFSNYTSGKVVDVIFYNANTTASKVVTHGCYSNNSTTNTTTNTIHSSNTAHFKYFCMSEDLRNTYVSVQYTQ